MKMNVFINRKDGKAEANGVFEDGKIVVKKGSRIKLDSTSQFKGFSIALENRENKDIVDNKGIVKKDVEFNSPSMAGAFILGSSVNGWTVWKTKDGKKLSEIAKEK